MDYENLTAADRRQLAMNSVRELESQHFQACIQITINKGLPGSDPRELEKRRDAIAQGIRNLRREYADLLVEPTPSADELGELGTVALEAPQSNGRALHAVGAD